MATTTIGGSDLTLLRSTNHAIDDIGLWVVPLTVVTTLTVATLPSTYPTISFTFTGSSTGVTTGQLVKITSGSTVKAWAVVRLPVSGSTLFISETALGASGYAVRIENAIEVGDTVTVYNHHPLWNLNSRISNKIFYKYFNVAYTNQNSLIPPVANTGEWQAAKLATGVTTARFRLPRVGSNTSLPIGTTISTYLWTLPAGVTIVSGYTTSMSVIEVDAVAGNHLVSLTVTDANAKTHTAYCWLFVSNGTTGASLDERYSVQITSDSQDRKGRKLSVTITGDSSLADVIYAGAGVLLRVWYDYEGSNLTEGVAVDSFVGYISDTFDISHDGDIYTATFIAQSPFLVAARIAQPPQSLEEKASPTKWTECTSSLSNPQGYLYYAIKWHCPALLDMHDFDAGSYTTPRRRFCQYNTNNLAAAMEVPAQFIRGNVGSASNGTTVLRKNPNYLNNTDRNALDVLLTFLSQDLRRKFDYSKRWGQEFQDALTGAFATNGTVDKAFKSIKKWMQGIGRSELPDSVVTIAEGQTKVNEIVGHYLAEQNADIQELTLFLNGLIDVVDPAYLDKWIRFTVDAEFDPLGVGFTSERATATRVNRTWELTKDDIYLTVDLSVKPETFGQPGEVYPIGNATTNNTNGWNVTQPVPYTPSVDSAFSGNGMAIIIDDNGNMAVTYNILDGANTNWIDLTTRFTGLVNDADWDYNSTFFSSGNLITEPLGLYVVTTSSTSFLVYRFSDIKDAGNIPDLLNTETMNDASVTTEGRIKCSEATPTLVLAAFKDRTGTEFIRSTDGGSVWSSKVNIGSTVSESSNDNAPLGLDVYNQLQVVSAPNATPEYGAYKATTSSGSFTEVTNTQRSISPLPLVKLIDSTSGYVSYINESTTSIVTFDVGGYSSYVIDGVRLTTSEAAVGNPGDAAQGTAGAISGAPIPYLRVTVTFPSDITLLDFRYNYYANVGGISTATLTAGVSLYNGGVLGTQTAWDREVAGGGSMVEDSTWRYTLWEHDNISGSFLPEVCDEIRFTLEPQNGGSSYDCRIDNIEMVYTGSGVTVTKKLYRVTTITGSSLWTDISPATDVTPQRPHDLAIDRITPVKINLVGSDAKWYSSVNSGTAYTTRETSTTKLTPLTQGEGVIFGGTTGEVKISLDSGVTFTTCTGNLATIWSSVGNIKKVLIL